MTTVTRLSSRQRAILEALAAGGTLRWTWRGICADWGWVLDDVPVDGRSVNGLVRRWLIRWPGPEALDSALAFTEAGRHAVDALTASESARVVSGATNSISGAPEASSAQ